MRLSKLEQKGLQVNSCWNRRVRSGTCAFTGWLKLPSDAIPSLWRNFRRAEPVSLGSKSAQFA